MSFLPHKKFTWAFLGGGYKYRYPPPSLRPCLPPFRQFLDPHLPFDQKLGAFLYVAQCIGDVNLMNMRLTLFKMLTVLGTHIYRVQTHGQTRITTRDRRKHKTRCIETVTNPLSVGCSNRILIKYQESLGLVPANRHNVTASCEYFSDANTPRYHF